MNNGSGIPGQTSIQMHMGTKPINKGFHGSKNQHFNTSKYGGNSHHNQSQSPVSKTFFPKDQKNKPSLVNK